MKETSNAAAIIVEAIFTSDAAEEMWTEEWDTFTTDKQIELIHTLEEVVDAQFASLLRDFCGSDG